MSSTAAEFQGTRAVFTSDWIKETKVWNMERKRSNTGAYEEGWGGTTVTITDGCGNGRCRYCYARSIAKRFRGMTDEQWAVPKIRQAEVDKQRKYYKYQPVFFQSASDITPDNLEACSTVLEKLLAVGNKVLIVTKPRWSCVKTLCGQLEKYRAQVLWRFTIGSLNDHNLSFWEPNTSRFRERLECLKYAYKANYATSVSCEPYLDDRILTLYTMLRPWISDSFWIGILRNFGQRVDLSNVTDKQLRQFVDPLREAQTDEAVRDLVKRLDGKPLVKWKDSIKKILQEERTDDETRA